MMKWAVAICAAFVGIVFWLWSETVAVRYTVLDVAEASPRLAETIGDARVVFLSDFHTGQTSVRERRVLHMLSQAMPDLIILGGDYINEPNDTSGCREFLTAIANIAPTIGIFGNNDHSDSTGLNLIQQWSSTGIHFLQNDAVIVVLGDGGNDSLAIVGVDDNYSWFDDPIGASHGVPIHLPRLLLAHAPDIATKLPPSAFDLILSGHTHGGQITVPLIGSVYRQPVCNARRFFDAGLYLKNKKFDHAPVFVSRGVGTSMLPLRLFSQPEIVLLRTLSGY